VVDRRLGRGVALSPTATSGVFGRTLLAVITNGQPQRVVSGCGSPVKNRAGAVRAMELDINTEWVSFMTYDSIRNPINPPATKLLPEFRQNEGRYFNTDERDFVPVYSR
jgi:hypothetical protein